MTYLSILKTAFFSTNLRNLTKQILLMNKNLNIFSLFGSFLWNISTPFTCRKNLWSSWYVNKVQDKHLQGC
jgi:hypothetical protein